MDDAAKTKAQLIEELQAARRRIAELEHLLAQQAVGARENTQLFQVLRESEARCWAEESLAQERNLMRTLIDNIPDYIYVKSTEGRFVLNNRASLRDFGLTSQDEITGKTDFDFFPAAAAAEYSADEQHVLTLDQPLVNKEIETVHFLTGEKMWLLTTKVSLKDDQGQIIGLIGISRDITELKQAREAIAISRDALRRLIQQLPIGVQVFDTNGLCLDVNEALLQIFGIKDRDQLVEQYNLFDDPMAARAGTQTAGRAALSGRTVHLAEVYFDFNWADPRFAQQHQSRVLSVIFFPIRNAENEIVQLVALNEDITERKQLAEQLQQVQKMEAVGQLAGGVAHNFNNMLTAMMGYTSLALENLPADHPSYQDLLGIRRITKRAADLTQQLLAFTRRQVIRPRVINLNEAILQLNSLLRQLVTEAVELIILPSPNLGQVKIDPNQFEQILINLVVNGRDAMLDGGKLTIETANVTLGEVYVESHLEVTPGDYVLLAVSDTGTGMSEEVKRRIFEPFFTTKEVGQGTGLGLSTCFGIVKQNNGHLTVYSEAGQGTTFKVYLPRVDALPDKLPILEQIDELPRGTETILLVEDETNVREMAKRILERQGYTVLAANNGQEALHLVEGQPELPLHLLITDVILPKMNGSLLAKKLKGLRPTLKVLFVSGYTDNAIVHHGVLEPGILFLSKPFTPDLLARKVRAVLDDEMSD